MTEIELNGFKYCVRIGKDVHIFDNPESAIDYAQLLRNKTGNINIDVFLYANIVCW